MLEIRKNLKKLSDKNCQNKVNCVAVRFLDSWELTATEALSDKEIIQCSLIFAIGSYAQKS